MPNYYETVFIMRPNAEGEAVEAAVAATKEHITAAGGDILYENTWGKRKLAYAVGDCTEGIYAQLNFQADPGYPPTLERFFRLSDDIIRDIVIRMDGPPPAPEDMINPMEPPAIEGRGREEGESGDARRRPRDDEDDDGD